VNKYVNKRWTPGERLFSQADTFHTRVNKWKLIQRQTDGKRFFSTDLEPNCGN